LAVAYLKFDLSKLERLNDPGRFDTLIPEAMWVALGQPSDARTIVEIGAGTGLFSARFARLAPNALIYAADLEPAMVDWMHENRPEVADGRLRPILAEESRVPLADGAADVVVMINVHHELVDPVVSYRDALRLLESGGRLLAVDWDRRETPKGPPQEVRASSAEVVALLEEVGFIEVTDHPVLPWHWMVTGVAGQAAGREREK
jgi:SAM-dependent methyltransferase